MNIWKLRGIILKFPIKMFEFGRDSFRLSDESCSVKSAKNNFSTLLSTSRPESNAGHPYYRTNDEPTDASEEQDIKDCPLVREPIPGHSQLNLSENPILCC